MSIRTVSLIVDDEALKLSHNIGSVSCIRHPLRSPQPRPVWTPRTARRRALHSLELPKARLM
ncbi:hypothetical protein BV25DRAFT_284109 [Artomyces pyxidatus]|uniref:Uncharacterized protein n=1 Tax=Artomyces pyxidatus TaxID=48021 RepID=A0ACB8T951_9AGAM|nr:hypothetical protein BV25DRAFT_284109 [Artomyces pyxidatus]